MIISIISLIISPYTPYGVYGEGNTEEYNFNIPLLRMIYGIVPCTRQSKQRLEQLLSCWLLLHCYRIGKHSNSINCFLYCIYYASCSILPKTGKFCLFGQKEGISRNIFTEYQPSGRDKVKLINLKSCWFTFLTFRMSAHRLERKQNHKHKLLALVTYSLSREAHRGEENKTFI